MIEKIEETQVPLVIYHSPCADGFTAAWVIWTKHKDWEFRATKYGDPVPDNIDNRVVYMVDFSYKRPVILEMAKKAHSIFIIDHHKTAQADLIDLPDNVYVTFDMEHSGARLTWDYFNQGASSEDRPALIKYVEDRDLWRFKYPETKDVSAYVFSNPYKFDIWDDLAHEIKYFPNEVIRAGLAIEQKQRKDIDELSAIKFRTDIGGYSVWAANVPYTYASDLANKLAEGEPFGVTYFYDGPRDKYVYSLRSKEDGIDVSEIAKTFGGGGHKHAAGFESPLGALKVCKIG